VYCGEGISQRPANQAAVVLMKDNLAISTFSTSTDGAYTISASIHSNASYALQVNAKCGSASMALPKDIKSALVSQNIHLQN
jgi:hypothetical protein